MNIESSKYKGLTDEEVTRKQEQEGFNELPSSKSKSILQYNFTLSKNSGVTAMLHLLCYLTRANNSALRALGEYAIPCLSRYALISATVLASVGFASSAEAPLGCRRVCYVETSFFINFSYTEAKYSL